MKAGFGIACLVLMLLAAATPSWAVEPVGPVSEAALYILRGRGDVEPTAEDLVSALNRTTVNLLEAGEYSLAEINARETLALAERDLGQEHQGTFAALNNLADLYHEQGRYDEAESLLVRVRETEERILGRDHSQTLLSINNLAELYRVQGRYSEAEPLYLQVLETRKRTLGQDHSKTLLSINNLAVLYSEQGRYDEAKKHLVRVREIYERVLGKDHLDTLRSINNLAILYEAQARYGEAEPLFVRALEGHERVLGRDHPKTLLSVNALAGLYDSQRRDDEAERLYKRVCEASERILGKNHPDTLISVNNLGFLYYRQGRYDKAESLYLHAQKTSEQVYGKDYIITLQSVNNLAVLYGTQGHYDKAEPWYIRALEDHERVLGEDHPKTLTSANNLAWLYNAQSRYDKAKLFYMRALEGRERVLGKEHPDTLGTRGNLAYTLINRGQLDQALEELRRSDKDLRGFVGTQLDTTLNERTRRRWLVIRSKFQHLVFSLALRYPRPDTLRLAADVSLRWKRLAEESEALTARLVRSSQNPQVMTIAKELGRYRADLSRLMNLPVPDKNAIAAIRTEVERREVELARLSREYRRHRANRDVDWKQIRSGLPKGSALLSLRAFRPVDFATDDSGEPHWLALLIPADPGDGPEILLKDLGPTEPMVKTQRALRETVSKEWVRKSGCLPAVPSSSPLRKTDSKELARKLYQMLFGKLDAELTKYDRLYIAPDGMLDLVPFARLILPDGHYWVERQELHRIQTGRDLIESGSNLTSVARGMVVYGGVDYGEVDCSESEPSCPESESSSAAKQAGGSPVTSEAVDGNRMLAMNQRLRSGGHCFDLLESSGREAKAIADFYWDSDNSKAEVWRNQDASETRLKSLLKSSASPPRILHLATHGFFLGKDKPSERPLTLAGLALAGANDGLYDKTSPTDEDGILYALEAQDLNLEGTELVTLSACDTGRGEVDYSEGVYGLVRAFRIAGARHVLMSLWKLNDSPATGFMKDFYAKWFEDPGRHPAEILREIQLAWIRAEDSKRSRPKYWAPYVLIEGR
ncbi:CHAT domain-containing tetratricopeptide repeat protein [Candidatus Thiosymbion oneisti]|uniref:CHAT domain-containing tetratricopeptide repeat protein n=1 Tax=Candidatus Thiosymbion oneisti TaxID=589554 RepID=UPI000A741D52|nr:CHAT domain-containing tetratricopeptide repeat protein [Candidatus Thiosymbion oneisti]